MISFSATTATSVTSPAPPPLCHNPSIPSPQQNGSNSLPESAIASWTSSMQQHCRNGRLSKAVTQFTRMRESGIHPNHITFVTLFSGCARSPSEGLSVGPAVHGYARKLGLDVHDAMVGTAVINMYSKFGEIGMARLSFDGLHLRNKFAWNTLIDGYIRNGDFEEALNLFDEMPERDTVSWTVLIDGFVQKGRFEEALELFQAMQLIGVAPDFVTIIKVLSPVAKLGTFGLGLWLHRYVLMQDFRDNVRINNSLIDMYCRCGCVEFACQVFDKMRTRNLVSWNSIIVGLACNAHAEKALSYFHSMESNGFKPDSVTFTGALTACSHAGLVDEGVELFETMTSLHKIIPTIEHYGCIVDLYSRAGRLNEAMTVVGAMPMQPNEVVLGSLLAACRACADTELADRLMSYINKVDPSGDFGYVLMSNIYASKGSWRVASNVRKKMKALGVQKKPGKSSIEVNGSIHEFMAGDQSHADAETIHTMLELLSYEVSLSIHDSDYFQQTCELEY